MPQWLQRKGATKVPCEVTVHIDRLFIPPDEKAEHWARDWAVHFGNAGEAGHFTEASGHGPWPEGLMAFAKFTQLFLPSHVFL